MKWAGEKDFFMSCLSVAQLCNTGGGDYKDTELEKTWKEQATTCFKIISWHFPKGLVTAMKNVCQDSVLPKI